MEQWYRTIQDLTSRIDRAILAGEDAALTLGSLARELGYSEFYLSRKFRQAAGLNLGAYIRGRTLAFALKRVRDTGDTLLEIAQSCGYSSNEAFSRAFREQFGVNPSQYRRDPRPVVLRTMLRPFDCYLLEIGGTGMENAPGDVKVYYVTIPAHKFLHIRNFESNGYWDFWQRQSAIPGQDCETICGLLDSIPGKLDDQGDSLENSGSGQVMAFWNHPQGRTGSWGIPQAECYGVRLPQDYSGPVPEQMLLLDIPEGEYAVFEHGPFHYETQGAAVEDALQQAMTRKDYAGEGYALDETPGRIAYFYHDCTRQTKYVRPVRPLE